jgi:hypothetical protein
MVVVVAGGAVLSGCATWNKGLDVAQGALGAASATVEIFRAAGRDTEALWGNVWTPFGLGDTPLTQPFDAPKVE